MPLAAKKELFSRTVRNSEVTKLSGLEAAFKAASSVSDPFKLSDIVALQTFYIRPASKPAHRPAARSLLRLS